MLRGHHFFFPSKIRAILRRCALHDINHSFGAALRSMAPRKSQTKASVLLPPAPPCFVPLHRNLKMPGITCFSLAC